MPHVHGYYGACGARQFNACHLISNKTFVTTYISNTSFVWVYDVIHSISYREKNKVFIFNMINLWVSQNIQCIRISSSKLYQVAVVYILNTFKMCSLKSDGITNLTDCIDISQMVKYYIILVKNMRCIFDVNKK